jgi:hypothetical protein
MNANDGRAAQHLGTEAFLEKWMPQTLTPERKSEFLMDLERLVLARSLEREPAQRRSSDDPAEFNWSDRRALAVKRVCALAIYRSAEGDIVIRQEGPDGQEDTVVVIPLGFAASVIEAIQRQFRDGFTRAAKGV